MIVGDIQDTLRPVFGSGEDWNGHHPRSTNLTARCARSSDRARIGTYLSSVFRKGATELRPVFGSGEDWNVEITK